MDYCPYLYTYIRRYQEEEKCSLCRCSEAMYTLQAPFRNATPTSGLKQATEGHAYYSGFTRMYVYIRVLRCRLD